MSYRPSLAFVVAALVLGPVTPAGAHGTQQAAGAEFRVGWADEPTFVGFKNAVQLVVRRGEQPVEGLADSIKVEVTHAEESVGPLDMRPVFGQPGEYQADLIPTSPGAYTFQFTGTVEGQPLDIRMTSGEETFDEVRGTSEVTFPEQAPPNSELAQSIDSLADRVEQAADSSSDAADGAKTFGYIGIGLGGLALALALVALLRRGG